MRHVFRILVIMVGLSLTPLPFSYAQEKTISQSSATVTVEEKPKSQATGPAVSSGEMLPILQPLLQLRAELQKVLEQIPKELETLGNNPDVTPEQLQTLKNGLFLQEAKMRKLLQEVDTQIKQLEELSTQPTNNVQPPK